MIPKLLSFFDSLSEENIRVFFYEHDLIFLNTENSRYINLEEVFKIINSGHHIKPENFKSLYTE